jgi:hypothetical protein
MGLDTTYGQSFIFSRSSLIFAYLPDSQWFSRFYRPISGCARLKNGHFAQVENGIQVNVVNDKLASHTDENAPRYVFHSPFILL